jgi:hypothetical protein
MVFSFAHQFFVLALTACLKFLNPGELQNLELPETPAVNRLIKEVVYRSSQPYIKDDISSHTENSRFNSFTGYQMLPEREESFKVSISSIRISFGLLKSFQDFLVAPNFQCVGYFSFSETTHVIAFNLQTAGCQLVHFYVFPFGNTT